MWRLLRKTTLTHWIIIATVAGAVVGWLDHDVWLTTDVGAAVKPLSNIFLRLIKSIVVPLIFGSLLVGIAGHGDDLKRVGRLALKSIVYFEIVTTLALLVGLAAVNLVRPGSGVSLAVSAEDARQLAGTPVTLSGVLEHTVPQSFIEAAARNEVLQVVFFTVLFAVGLTQVKAGRGKDAVLSVGEGLTEVMFKFTNMVMRFAPFGIFAAVVGTIGKNGIGMIVDLGKLVLTLYGALIVFLLLVLVPVALIARIPIRRFWHWVQEPWLLALTTASSEAARPRLHRGEPGGGAPPRDGEHGEVRRPPPDRVVRAAHRLLVQSRRLDALPVDRRGLRGPGRRDRHRYPDDPGAAAGDDADPDADQQRGGRGSPRFAGHSRRRPRHLRASPRGGGRHSRGGRLHGHGPDLGEPAGELSRLGGHGPLGRRAPARTRPGITRGDPHRDRLGDRRRLFRLHRRDRVHLHPAGQREPERVLHLGPPGDLVARRRVDGGHHLRGRHPPGRHRPGRLPRRGGQLALVELRDERDAHGVLLRPALAPGQRDDRCRARRDPVQWQAGGLPAGLPGALSRHPDQPDHPGLGDPGDDQDPVDLARHLADPRGRDLLPHHRGVRGRRGHVGRAVDRPGAIRHQDERGDRPGDRKSTRLNSSH